MSKVNSRFDHAELAKRDFDKIEKKSSGFIDTKNDVCEFISQAVGFGGEVLKSGRYTVAKYNIELRHEVELMLREQENKEA